MSSECCASNLLNLILVLFFGNCEQVFVDHLGNKDERFTPDVLMKKIKNIGWVVDLTNTNKYYDPQVSNKLDKIKFYYLLFENFVTF